MTMERCRWRMYIIDPDNCDYRLESHRPAASMGAQPPLGGVTAVTHKEKRLVTWGELKIK